MKNNYILLELNDKNEIRTKSSITISSLNIENLTDINIKIDTGCPNTSIPIQKLGISYEKAQEMKQLDCNNTDIIKEISFGVNDTKEKRQLDRKLKTEGRYMELKSVTFKHKGFILDIDGVQIKNESVKVSYDRVGNILIGMDVLSNMDIHIGVSRVLNKTILLACPYDSINNEYYGALDEHFNLCSKIIMAVDIL